MVCAPLCDRHACVSGRVSAAAGAVRASDGTRHCRGGNDRKSCVAVCGARCLCGCGAVREQDGQTGNDDGIVRRVLLRCGAGVGDPGRENACYCPCPALCAGGCRGDAGGVSAYGRDEEGKKEKTWPACPQVNIKISTCFSARGGEEDARKVLRFAQMEE